MRTGFLMGMALTLGMTRTAESQEVETLKIPFRGVEMLALAAGPSDGDSVLLLHGARFHSGTWQEIGTYRRLAKSGFRVVGLDLPGFGGSPKADIAPERLLTELLPILGLGKPVIVAPSMSGRYALPLVIENPKAVTGLVAVSPAGVREFEPRLAEIRVPTLIVWGEKDEVFPLAMGKSLESTIAGSKLIVLEGARHPCYLDRPEDFHRALLDFLRSLTSQ